MAEPTVGTAKQSAAGYGDALVYHSLVLRSESVGAITVTGETDAPHYKSNHSACVQTCMLCPKSEFVFAAAILSSSAIS